MTGLVPLDKAEGELSRRAMSAAARLFDERHAGHAGTLDPLATGVLPVLLGRACKLLPYLPQEKRYTAGVQFGFRTDTADVTGCRVLKNPKMPTRDELLEILPRFTGKVDQIPPMYAAVKLDGRPLYEYARAGRKVERRPRTVEIYALTLLEYDSVSMTAVLDVHCSGGTYVRTLCEDMAEALGAAAALRSLRRTMSAGIEIGRCYRQSQLEALNQAGRLQDAVISAEALFPHLEDRTVPREGETYYRNGGVIREDRLDGAFTGGLYRVYGASGAFIGLGTAVLLPDGPHLKSVWTEEI